MTTIAASRREMAGDSRVACGSVFYNSDKIFRIGDSFVGVCGDADNTTKFLSWFRRECPGDESTLTLDDDHTFAGLVLNSRGLFHYSNCCEPDHIKDKFYAIGCGADIAITAMTLGKSPAEAVRIACRIDPMHCGLPIKVLTLQKASKKRIPTPLPPAGAQTDAPTREGKI